MSSYGDLIKKNKASKIPAVRVIIPHADDPLKILVVWRKDEGKQPNMWEMPGGKPESETPEMISVEDVAREELYEEAGLKDVPDAHLVPFVESFYPFDDVDRVEAYLILESAPYMTQLNALVDDYQAATGDEGGSHTHAAWIDIRTLGDGENPVMFGTKTMLEKHLGDYLSRS